MRKGVRQQEQTSYEGRFKCNHMFIDYTSPYDFRKKVGCVKCGAQHIIKDKVKVA